MNNEAIKELLYKMADDDLIIGHRNSEWTGIGPMLEEDLAFSSMAQDKIGHAIALYNILHEVLGEPDPDTLGFKRTESEFKCCHLVEQPIGEYDFSTMRHFLFDHAELLRYEALSQSTFQPLALLSKKVKGEIKYHVMHADTFVKQLSNGTEESKARMQNALNHTWHLALGIFEEGPFEAELKKESIFIGEAELKQQWLQKVVPLLQSYGLTILTTEDTKIAFGGRKGFHTDFLKPLLDEMCEVTRTDIDAEW